MLKDKTRNPPEIQALHRSAILLGAAAGLATVAAYVIWSVLTADLYRIFNAVGPAILAAVCLYMLRRRIYRGEIVMIMAGLSTIVSYRFAAPEDPATPAAIGVVMIVSITALFVPQRWKWPYVWMGTVLLLLTGVFWEGVNQQAIWVGVSSALSGLVAMVLFIKMSEAAAASDRRYRVLIERLPVPLIEEDWSDVWAWLEGRRNKGVVDIEAYLDAHPRELSDALRLIKVRGVNPAIEKLAGPNTRTIEHDSLFGISHEDLRPYVRDEIARRWYGLPPGSADYPALRAGGDEVWARLETADIADGEIPGVDRIIAATDVTALKHAEADLEELVRSKDEFIAAVSHELRTPLTSVLGFAELIDSNCTTIDADNKEMLALLLNQARDMAHIVEDLLVAARAEIGDVAIEREHIELLDVIEEAIAQAGGGFEVDCEGAPTVYADRVRVTQILRNLATNANRYGGSERTLTVSADDEYARIRVCDNGDGVPVEARERIFEPYRRAHNRPGMTASVGLGLAVSRQLAELMGGTVAYRRNNGRSCFELRLPLAAVPVEPHT